MAGMIGFFKRILMSRNYFLKKLLRMLCCKSSMPNVCKHLISKSIPRILPLLNVFRQLLLYTAADAMPDIQICSFKIIKIEMSAETGIILISPALIGCIRIKDSLDIFQTSASILLSKDSSTTVSLCSRMAYMDFIQDF